MRHIKVLSIDPVRVRSHRPNWRYYGDIEVIPGIPGNLILAHQRLAHQAVEEEWNETVLVLQDDVVIMSHDLPEHQGEIMAYGTQRRSHVCPHAFSATQEGWERILDSWAGAVYGVCGYFRPDVVLEGIVEEVA